MDTPFIVVIISIYFLDISCNELQFCCAVQCSTYCIDTKFLFGQRNEDTYQGFIRVHMNLVRPINIIAGERPLSIFETVGVQREEDQKVSGIFMVVNQLFSSKP